MVALIALKPRKRQRLSSVLGLTLDGARLEGVWLRRTNGSLQVHKTLSASLTLDPVTSEAELVGREIRNRLEGEGIRERVCVVGLPLKWALTARVELPDLPEADIASFLQIEAERNFPCDPETLQVCTSIFESAGTKHALLIGIPRSHLVALESALRAARLKPLSFTLDVDSGINAPADMSLSIGESSIAVRAVANGCVAAVRSLEGTVLQEGSRSVLQAEIIARETRITLGQLPPGLRESIHTLHVLGPRDLAQQLADELELRLDSLALKIAVVTRYAGTEFGLHLPPEAPVSSAFTLAALTIAGRESRFEFLPPHVTPWQRVVNRYASGKWRTAGAAGILLLVGAAGAFVYQQILLTRLQAQWNAIAPQVRELQEVQAQIKQYRPWFDNSLRSMVILRELTTTFPEDGVVSAKSVEIRDGLTVTCTGVARDNPALLKTWDRLRESQSVADLKVDQIRGKSPMQFTFNFKWNPGGRGED